MRSAIILAVLAIWTVPAGTWAQTPNTVPAPAAGSEPKATLDDVRWLVGSWKGSGLGGVSEEIWAEPAGGAMVGLFRLVTAGAVTFYELMSLREEGGSLVLKLKHFGADFSAWEDKDQWVTFRLARVTPSEAYFGGLTYRRAEDGALRIYLALRDGAGAVREEAFVLKRQ